MAETKKDALVAFDVFVETWGVKYDKAVECLIKDRDALLAFYDFPAEHWKHLRTTDEMDKRFFSTASVTGLPILSCRAEAPARWFFGAAAVSIPIRIVRSCAPPGRQSTSRGRAAP